MANSDELKSLVDRLLTLEALGELLADDDKAQRQIMRRHQAVYERFLGTYADARLSGFEQKETAEGIAIPAIDQSEADAELARLKDEVRK